MSESTLSYQQMFEQVEQIILRMQNQNLDLDEMIQEVRRGHGLIQKMRQRLKESESTIVEMKNELLGEGDLDAPEEHSSAASPAYE